MPRDTHRSRETLREDDQYIILVKDIPRHCRWQELKDMTRSLGGEQSLKAEVFELVDGSQLGHCTIKGRAAAVQVYDKLLDQGWNGQPIDVSLAVLEKPGVLKTIAGPTKSRRVVEAARPAHSPYLVSGGGPTFASRSPPSPFIYATFGQPPRPVNGPTSAVSLEALQPCYRPVSQAVHDTYQRAPSSAGRPPDTRAPPSHAPPRTSTSLKTDSPTAGSRPSNGCSAVLLSNLPPCQSGTQLRALLKRYGTLLSLDLHSSGQHTSQTKCTARALFRSTSEAQTAVRRLDGASLSRCKIKALLVEENSATAEPLPTPESKNAGRETKNAPASKAAPKASTHVRKHMSKQHAQARPQPQHPQGRSKVKGEGSGGVAKSAAGPLVVNGATGPQHRHWSRGGREDSSEDDSDTEACRSNTRRGAAKSR